MPWQLIYTSAPRGLLSGQTGFCTVARSADLREALAQRLEQMSSYHYMRVAEAATANRNPTVSAFRLLDFRGIKYYVLTRIQPCGLDFTARTNHLAHHVIFQLDEVPSLPSPAAILRFWPGWLSSWQGEPRLLDAIDLSGFAAATRDCLPARTWARVTGDGGRAAGLLELHGTYLNCPIDSQELVLAMYCETLQLLNFNGQFPLRPWRHTFTNFLQAEDNPNDFQWRACQENTPAYKQALAKSATIIALRSIRVPANSLVKLAREDAQQPPLPPKAPESQPPPVEGSKTLSLRPRADSKSSDDPPLAPPHPVASGSRRQKGGLQVNIRGATLLRVGIVIVVLAVLLFVKRWTSRAPVEQPMDEPVPSAPVRASVKPKPEPVPEPVVIDDTELNKLVGDGPTFLIAAKDISSVIVTNPMSPLLNLLKRYDHLDTYPSNIVVDAANDQWGNVQGEPLTVHGRAVNDFKASGGGLTCSLKYAGYISTPPAPLKIEARGDRNFGSYFMHFRFDPAAAGDPFRLLVVSETNPPKPVRLPSRYVHANQTNFNACLSDSVRACLATNFILTGGRQWQFHPYVTVGATNSQYLYKDWPSSDIPGFGRELDFVDTEKRLQGEQQSLREQLDALCQPLGVPVGKSVGQTNDNLVSFLAYASNEVSTARFAEYLGKIKNAAPETSWIRSMREPFYNNQPDVVSTNFQKVYDDWSGRRPQTGAASNYFVTAWQIVNDAGALRVRLGDVQRRLDQLNKVSYVALGIVDPSQPKPGLEMIRFETP